MIAPGTRVRTCEECRVIRRKQKTQERVEARASAWKTGSTAEGPATVDPDGGGECPSGGLGTDADGEGSDESEEHDNPPGPMNQLQVVEFIHEQFPVRPRAASQEPGSSDGFLKFRVSLTKPTRSAPTADQPMNPHNSPASSSGVYISTITPTPVGNTPSRDAEVSVGGFTNALDGEGVKVGYYYS